MTLETDKNKMKPMEQIPAEWYRALVNFLDREDASGLVAEMFGGAITEEELTRFKNLHSRQKAVGDLETSYEQESSPLKLSKQEWQEFMKLDAKIALAGEELARKINPF